MQKPITILAIMALVVVCCPSHADGQARFVAGASIPIGPFAGKDSATGGFALPGIAAGLEYSTGFFFGTEIGISGILCWQPYDVAASVRSQPHLPSGMSVSADPWILFWPTLNVGYPYDLSEVWRIYSRGFVGGFYGFYPGITSNDNGVVFTQDMSIDIAFSYGGTVGVIIDKRYDIGVRVLAARPHYDVNVQGGGISTNEKQLRSTAVILITAAYVF